MKMKSFIYSKQFRNRLLNGVCFCLLLAAFLTSLRAEGKPADFVGIGNIQNLDLGTWVGIGSLGSDRTFCVASADEDRPKPPNSASTMPYQLRVDDSNGSAGDFYVYLNGDTGNNGNGRIRVTIEHKDLLDGNNYEQLTEGAWDTHAHNGQFRNCTSGDNSRLNISISSSEMAGKLTGTYRGDFTVRAIGGSSGSATDSNSFRLSVTIQATPEVQITSLDNIPLGTHAGLGTINAEESFCVYSTSASGSYNLSVSSTNQDAGGNFYLDSTIGLGQIPYDLFFVDQPSGPGSVEVTNNTVSGFGNSTDQFCNGVNNATLSVTIQEQDLQQASSGTYQDSLVILVAPQ